MTFEEFYKILYEKYDIARADYSDKKFKIKPSITIDTFDLFDLIEGLKETYAPKIKMTSKQKDELMQLKIQVEISKAYFKNILEVDPNISIGSPSHLENCVRVMKTSAEKALEALEDTDD